MEEMVNKIEEVVDNSNSLDLEELCHKDFQGMDPEDREEVMEGLEDKEEERVVPALVEMLDLVCLHVIMFRKLKLTLCV